MNEKEIDKYTLAMEKRIASEKDIKSFAILLMKSEGVDPAIVNWKEEGVTVEKFNLLVNALYTAGYKDGLTQYTELLGSKRTLNRISQDKKTQENKVKLFMENNIYKN